MLKSQKLLLSLVLVAAILFAVLSAFPLAYAEELPPDMVAEEPLEPETPTEDDKQKMFAELETLVLEMIESEVGLVIQINTQNQRLLGSK